ncbi:retrovirus-related pol polyprotein from transposon TNT 1-94 [Tanacetum coccineum]
MYYEVAPHVVFRCVFEILGVLHKECECLAQKLSKQTESVNKEVHNKLLKSFAKLENHSISLELSLQHCKEQMKNNPVCKENASNVFRKEREQYHEIQDLKAQMQDKNIAISELKKLIEKCKGKSVETQFDKPSVVRQPNAQRIPKPSVLGKPTPFSNSPEMRITQQNLPQNRKQAEIHSNVLKPGMYRIATTTTQTRTPQLPHASRNTNPHVSTSTGVNHSTSVSRPQLKCYQVKDKVVPNNSQVKFNHKEVEEHHRISSISRKTKSVTACNDSSKSRTLNVNAVCAECGKYCKTHPFIVDSGCTKHMTGNLKLLCKFVEKFLDTVHFVMNNALILAEKTDSSQQGLEFLFSPLLEEYYNPTHGLAEENNNDQAPNASFQEAEFINPFCTRVQEIGESSSRNIDNTDVHSFQPQSHDYRWTRDHPLEQVRGNPTMPVQTRRQLATDPEMCMFALTVSIVEPKNIKEAMADSAWIEAMQDELHQFDRLKVWELVDKPFGKMIIKLKWLWKNKKDEDQTLLAWKQLGFSLPMQHTRGGYVTQPEGFVDPDHPEKVYLLRKSLYGLKQALRAWYDELSNFLMSKGFTKGTIDPTLFKIKYGEDILLVQIYVDDIIFGSTNPKYSKRFEKLMHSRFEMSLMGEMKFFLGLQIHQSPKGIFINQAKYALEILKKHNMDNCHSIGTPLATKPKLDVDLSGEPVDQSDYRSKIGSLMYLTSSRPDLVQAVCYCARYQARPTQKHLKEVKRIFKYLKGTINMGLWYPKDSGFELTAFSDADHAGCLDTRKSTSGGIQFLGDKLVSWMSKKQNCTAMSSAEAEYVVLSASCAQ